jgi:hypothetical protein
MRPVASERSFVRFPLNELLGTEANVRLLRTLCDEVSGPISAADAAQRSGLTEAGARRALARLARTGFVVRSGRGRSVHFGLRQRDGLVEALSNLYAAERRRFDALLAAIRAALEPLSEVRVAWISELPPRVGEPLHVHVLTDARSLPTASATIRGRIVAVEADFDLTIEVHSWTRADAPEVDWRRVTLIAGIQPSEGSERPPVPTLHSDRDRRALKLSEAIVDLIDSDASLITRAKQHIERILGEERGAAGHDLREWMEVLESYSPERLKRFLVADTPRANRLRQSSPFLAVLTSDQRDRVLESIEVAA